MVVHASDTSTGEAEVGEPGLHCKFEANATELDPVSKQNKTIFLRFFFYWCVCGVCFTRIPPLWVLTEIRDVGSPGAGCEAPFGGSASAASALYHKAHLPTPKQEFKTNVSHGDAVSKVKFPSTPPTPQPH